MKYSRGAKKQLVVFARDAGGAEVLAAFMKRNARSLRPIVYATGPASAVFTRERIRYSAVRRPNDVTRILARHGKVRTLFGTGAGTFELVALKEAKRRRLHTAAYLDSWIQYRERFGYPARGWRKNLPDELWVGDNAARRLARKYFKRTHIRLMPNRYLAEVTARYKARKKSADKSTLFMSAAGPLSETLLNDFLHVCVKRGVQNTVRVRLHPEDDSARFKRILKRFGHVHTELSREKDIVKDLVRARVVVGPETVALVPAHLVGIKTIRIVPRGEKSFLPFPRIRTVRDAEAAARLVFRKK